MVWNSVWQVHGRYAYSYDIYHMYMMYEQLLCIIHHDVVRLYAAEARLLLKGPDKLCPWLSIVQDVKREALVLQALQQDRSHCACRRQNAFSGSQHFHTSSLSGSNKLSPQMHKGRLCTLSVPEVVCPALLN